MNDFLEEIAAVPRLFGVGVARFDLGVTGRTQLSGAQFSWPQLPGHYISGTRLVLLTKSVTGFFFGLGASYIGLIWSPAITRTC